MVPFELEMMYLNLYSLEMLAGLWYIPTLQLL